MVSVNKLVAAVTGGVLVVAVALNSYTTVPAGHVKVQTLFGKVTDQPLTEGFHLVNPLKSFDTISTRNDKYEVNGLNIPTQDRFNSEGNITVTYRIDGSKGNYIKTNYGTSEEYIDKTLRQQLRAIIRDEGRKLADSRSLADSTSVTDMQVSTKSRLKSKLDGTGIIIEDVLVQDIKFDSRIAAQILKTQNRIQQEQERLSQERIAETNTKIATLEAQAEGNRKREAAKARAFEITSKANAEKEANITVAEGEAESIKLIADANVKLSRSLTPAILKKQELDNEGVLYSKSVGNVPNTVIGKTDLRALGVPVATLK